MGNSTNTLTVSTELGAVQVRKMALSDYAELLRALDKLPKQVGKILEGVDLKKLDNAKTLELIPRILADSWADLVALIAVPTDKDAAFLGRLDGADALDVLDAILELNDFARIAAAVKKILARRAKTTPAKVPQKQT